MNRQHLTSAEIDERNRQDWVEEHERDIAEGEHILELLELLAHENPAAFNGLLDRLYVARSCRPWSE